MINYLNDSWQGKFTGFVEKQQGSRPPMILPDKECGNCAFSCMAQSLLLHYKMCRNDMFYPQMVSLHDVCSKWQGMDSKK